VKAFFAKYYDKRLSLILVGFYLITVALNLFKVFAVAYLRDTPLAIGKDFHYQIYLIDIVLVMIIMQVIAMHTKRLILNKTPWKYILLFHFVLAIFIGVIIQGVTDFYRIQFGISTHYDFKVSLRNFLSVIDVNFLVYFAMIFIIYTYYYFDIIRAKEIQQSQLESQLVTTKLNTLKMQLEPHFLFNTLNAIIGLIDIDKKRAQNTLIDLSSLLRMLTKKTMEHEHRLDQELEMVHHYIDILKVRFEDELKVDVEIEEGLLDKTVPTMLFQPLIENAINHGFAQTSGMFHIQVRGYEEGDKMVFVVENNGNPISENASTKQTGVGVSNLQQRLKNLYGRRATYVLRNKEQGVENVIEIPL
jgi:two-component system LytT family sensor kinase